MFRRIFVAALGAGVGVGLLLASLQHVALVPLILEAEKYENRSAEPNGQTGFRQPQLKKAFDVARTLPAPVGQAHAHSHDATTQDIDDSLRRSAWTWIATTLTSIGFAMALVGAFAVSGREVNTREGVLWGLAGFAAFSLAPAFGLPPELPGAVAADLALRQLWWIATAALTILGLGLLVFGQGTWPLPVGLALIAAPHLVGAPHPGDGSGSAPPELAAAFAARSLVVAAIFWSVLGWACGTFYARLGRAEA
jgi:cobalt transporter subunit CbtA